MASFGQFHYTVMTVLLQPLLRPPRCTGSRSGALAKGAFRARYTLVGVAGFAGRAGARGTGRVSTCSNQPASGPWWLSMLLQERGPAPAAAVAGAGPTGVGWPAPEEDDIGLPCPSPSVQAGPCFAAAVA